MSAPRRTWQGPVRYARRQRGVVLFIALIALVTIMLAAVALMRSVDTATVISGNLAFKQAATASADGGLESALAWLKTTAAGNTTDPFVTLAHPFNQTTAATPGYYSSADPTLNLTAAATWTTSASADAGTDPSGNAMRYIIQRMCRTPNQVLSNSNCLFSDAESDTNTKNTGDPTAVTGGKHPIYRVTVRAIGPRSTASYIQAFIY
jgi:type IV pilus assembly protein PilX